MAISFSDAEGKRFATCLLNMKDMSSIDWAAAAAQYDPKVKPESFKTVTLRALKKARDSAGISSPAANGDGGKGGRKRKGTPAETEEGGEGEEKPKRGRKVKKSKAGVEAEDAEGEGEGEAVVMAEDGEEDA